MRSFTPDQRTTVYSLGFILFCFLINITYSYFAELGVNNAIHETVRKRVCRGISKKGKKWKRCCNPKRKKRWCQEVTKKIVKLPGTRQLAYNRALRRSAKKTYGYKDMNVIVTKWICGSRVTLIAPAMRHFEDAVKECVAEKKFCPQVVFGYRSNRHQHSIRTDWCKPGKGCKGPVAPAGGSFHISARAFDILTPGWDVCAKYFRKPVKFPDGKVRGRFGGGGTYGPYNAGASRPCDPFHYSWPEGAELWNRGGRGWGCVQMVKAGKAFGDLKRKVIRAIPGLYRKGRNFLKRFK